METLKDVLYFVFDAIDLPEETERTCQNYIQAQECLNKYLQIGIVSDDSIKEAQNKIDKKLYIAKNKKDYDDPEYESINAERNELVIIVSDLNGCRVVIEFDIVEKVLKNQYLYKYKND